MESKFDQLVTIFKTSPLSTDVLQEIILLLEQQTNETLTSFISQSFQSLHILSQWSWQIFSEDFHQWVNQPFYQDFFNIFASFNKKVIYHHDTIETDVKASFLFPESIKQVNSIFQQIEQNDDDNNSFIKIVSLWFDNHSHFLLDNPQYSISSVMDHIGQYIVRNYIMSHQYKVYLSHLRQRELTQAIFTNKMLFYIKTCSFYLYAYLAVKVHSFPYTADGIICYLGDDYLQIMNLHSHAVGTWSEELLGCIAQLTGLVCGCCWWDGQKRTQMKILLPTEKITCDHIEDLIRVVGHEPFYERTKSVRSNDETALMDSIFMILIIIVQTHDINWFFRSNTTIRDTIISAAAASLNDEVSLCGYGILGEALADEDLKDLRISDHISDYFFNILENAWHHSSKKYKQISITYLLKAFQTLSKNDSIQQRAFQMDKTSLFIEICDQHLIGFDIIWALSFNQDIQEEIRSSSIFMSKLAQLNKECDDEQMRKITHGILWNLEINHEDHATSETSETKTFDIMISYSHKDKTLCQQIYKELTEAGYRVWIDFDQMHGNVMDAMAQAIEQSHTVVICMSEDYRKSNYCRAEAHYAFQRQRKIVPIVLQKFYKPDGWLLFLTGHLLYVDFNKYEFGRAMEMLFKKFKVEDKSETNVLTVYSREDTHRTLSFNDAPMPKVLPSQTISQNIIEWTETQVQQWLTERNLLQMSQLLTNCDGRSLIYLKKYIKNGGTQQILNLLQEESRRRTNQSLSLIELSRFLSLMDQQNKLSETNGTNVNIEKQDG